MDTGVWILIAFIWIAIDAFLASEFMDAAEEKGYDDRKYFWFCLLFGLPGWMLVIALPDRPGRMGRQTAKLRHKHRMEKQRMNCLRCWIGNLDVFINRQFISS